MTARLNVTRALHNLSSVANESWVKHREWLVAAYGEATRSFDKAIMTLAGGALALSIAFVHDVAPKPEQEWALGKIGRAHV